MVLTDLCKAFKLGDARATEVIAGDPLGCFEVALFSSSCQSRSNQQLRDRPKQYGHNYGSRDAERNRSQPLAPSPYRGIAIGRVIKKSRPAHGGARDNFRVSVSGCRLGDCETLLGRS
jgi:hypothetical protein